MIDCENLIAQLIKIDKNILNDIIVIDNSPELGLCFDSTSIKHFKNNSNLGVSVSRNMGLSNASNNIVWFLDDDIILPDISEYKLKLLEIYFNSDPTLAILATKVTCPDGTFRKKEIPFINTTYATSYIRSASYFVGASFFAKKNIFHELGGFDNECFYGFEESDLAFRLIKNNYLIKYYPYIAIIHLGNPLGRLPSSVIFQNIFNNRVRIISRNLPRIFLVFHISIWFFYYFFKQRLLLKVHFSFSKFIPSKNPRYISYTLKNGGRLFY